MQIFVTNRIFNMLNTKWTLEKYGLRALASALIYHSNLSQNRGSRKPTSRWSLNLKLFLLSIWLASRRCAKFQIPNSILRWFLRHLNMAFLGYFTQFRIAVLARFLHDIYNFSNRVASFSIELEYFELKLNQLNDF